jgi:hypothetical protein
MDPRIFARNINMNAHNENGNLTRKIMIRKFYLFSFVSAAFNVKSNTMDTPLKSKLPFKDSTNKTSEFLKSTPFKVPAKGEASSSAQMKVSQGTGADLDMPSDFDFEPFVFPADKNCYCCGDSRKSKH